MANVTTETATVYRGGGRRWLTKKAACRAEARAAIKAKFCNCDTADDDLYGTIHLTCALHENQDRYQKMLRRVTRLFMAAK